MPRKREHGEVVEDSAPSDEQLLQQFRDGDRDAATRIYLRYAHRLRALARHRCSGELASCVDADDIVQSVFRTFFRRLRRGCYEVPHGEELWKLFLVIALNKISDERVYHRAAKRDIHRRAHGASIDDIEVHGADGEEARLHLRLTIEQVLAPLPQVYQQIVELRIAGYEVAEIAERTGRSKRTVERNLQQFQRSLERMLAFD